MRTWVPMATIFAALLLGGPAVAEQMGGHIAAEQRDIGRLETRIQKYDQALGVVIQLTRPAGAETECQGVCFFPEQHPPDFLALRAQGAMRSALFGQSTGRRVRLKAPDTPALGACRDRLRVGDFGRAMTSYTR